MKVARGHGTERAWTGLYNDNKEKGLNIFLKLKIRKIYKLLKTLIYSFPFIFAFYHPVIYSFISHLRMHFLFIYLLIYLFS